MLWRVNFHEDLHPILNHQWSPDSLVVAEVVGHEDGVLGDGVSGDHHVQFADQLSCSGELVADCGAGIFAGKIVGERL